MSELSVRVVYDDQIIGTASLPCEGRESPSGKEFRPVVSSYNGGNGWHDGSPSYQELLIKGGCCQGLWFHAACQLWNGEPTTGL